MPAPKGIKVNFTAIQEKVATLNSSFAELEAAITKATTAGSQAVAAGGGESTGVGAAIKAAIVDVSTSQLNSAKSQLELMISNLSTAASQYADKNADLIASINAIAAGSQTPSSPSQPAPSHGNFGPTSVMY